MIVWWYDGAAALSPPLYYLKSDGYILQGRQKCLELFASFGCPAVVSLDCSFPIAKGNFEFGT